MTRVGSEYAWVKEQVASIGAAPGQVRGRVADSQSHSGFTRGCGYLLLSAGITSYCLGKRRGSSRRESQDSCDEAPEVGSERRGPFPHTLGVVVRGCVRKHGAGREGEL